MLYILGFSLIICLPVYAAIVLVSPKLMALINDPVEITVALKSFSNKIQEAIGNELFNSESIRSSTRNFANRVPRLLSGTANLSVICSSCFLCFTTCLYMEKILKLFLKILYRSEVKTLPC